MVEVIYEGPVHGSIGYANAARNYVLALDKVGVGVQLKPYKWQTPDACLSDDIRERLEQLSNKVVARNAPRVQHAIADLFSRDELSRMNIGVTTFETDGMPNGWADKCNKLDVIVVPCDFNAKTFEKKGVPRQNLFVVPHVVDTENFRPNAQPIKIKNKRGFNFLSLFEFSHRKGWDVLLEAFWQEFKPQEDVSLTLKTYFRSSQPTHRQRVMRELKRFQLEKGFSSRENVFLYSEIIPEEFMPNFYRAFDCFVFPTRGEGFGLPVAEAMACEVPVIATNWSGHLQFCKPENCYLINVARLAVIDSKMQTITPNYKGQRWAEPDVRHLRTLMRQVYENKKAAIEKVKRGRELLQKRFSYEAVGNAFKKVIERGYK